MPFRTRNPYYLRISEKNVLPLYLYLDERHVEWMSDTILQHVLADLQPKILPKLKAEADALLSSTTDNKKATVDTHRGDSYQLCYFIRKTEPHSVLIKTRHFSAAPAQKKPDMPPLSRPQAGKRKGRKAESSNSPNKRRKTKGKGKAREMDENDDAASSDDEEVEENNSQPSNPRRSKRAKKLVAGGYQQGDASPDSDIDMEDPSQDNSEVKNEIEEPSLSRIPNASEGRVGDNSGGSAAPIDIDIEIEEEKPKPILKLKYQDFSIYGHCLCIVVEPYPSLRSASRAPQTAPREQSTAPEPILRPVASSLRARTPLFLPDDSDRERSETPAPFLAQRVLPPVPLFDDNDSDSNSGGMMEYSQALNDFNHPAGAADDDDDMDGAVFFGDADEVKEL
ncbi:hypothetical protein B0H10DRAFT_2209194 [Mycena sp. CBHHK59/15]|nr:hypothetical protein B0H10DRAFT_2209194 [Mycena sp. CBHHK59/15]